MKCFYDLHIHTALSPCGDADMTPNNVVKMSLLKGLDIIAISDHNSVGNVRAAMKVAEGTDLVVVPGMEVESEEEVHVLCLFPDIESAEKMWDIVKEHMGPVLNRPEIFGEQQYMNEEDEVVGTEEKLLVTATTLDFEKIKKYADEVGGVAVPAHVDRKSYSVLSNLGLLPDIGFETIEVSKRSAAESYAYLRKRIIQNSDAHYLEDIAEPENWVDLPEKSAKALVFHLKEQNMK